MNPDKEYIVPSITLQSFTYWVCSITAYLIFAFSLCYLSTAFQEWQKYDSAWRFTYGVTNLSTPWPSWIVVSLYAFFVKFFQNYMKDREPLRLRTFAICHNGFLSIISIIPFVVIMKNLLKSFTSTYSIWYILCSEEMHDNSELQFIYYLNYFLKFFELIDTFILVFRKKPVDNLHFFHHGATVILTYYEQLYHSTVQWGPIVFNVFVHIIMYYYYMLSCIGIRNIWWKKHLTTLQISQFVVDLVVCLAAWLNGYSERSCNGTAEGAIIGVGLIGIYLILFLQFYGRTYIRKEKKKDDNDNNNVEKEEVVKKVGKKIEEDEEEEEEENNENEGEGEEGEEEEESEEEVEEVKPVRGRKLKKD